MERSQGMGIRKTHLLVSLFIFTISSVIIVSIVYRNMMNVALKDAAQKASIILERNLAIHNYFSREMKPQLLKMANSHDNHQLMAPELISSIFAVRHIDRYVKNDKAADYYYKEAAINARSPENEATGYERDFIEKLNSGSKINQKSGVIKIDGKPYFYMINKGETITSECLPCHSSPSQAPKSIVEKYGAIKSFHRKNGEVISALSIRVPLSSAYANIRSSFISLCALLVGLFGFAMLALAAVTNIMIINPVKKIIDTISHTPDGDASVPQAIPPVGGLELRRLIAAFNAMSDDLREKNTNMEALVKTRTLELSEANKKMAAEIDERKRTEYALIKEKNLFQSIVDSMTDGITIRDLDYNLTFESNMQLELFGDRIGEKCYAVFAGKTEVCEGCPVKKSFEDGGVHMMVKEVFLPNGEKRYFENTSCPVRDADGKIVAALEINKDITARVMEEQRKEWLREQEKFAAIGRVAGKMAHDFNNILGIIMGMSGLLIRHETLSDDIMKKLKTINDCSIKGKDLTSNLLLFARDQEPKYTQFDVNERIHGVIESLACDLEGIKVKTELADGLKPLVADPWLLENALVNLIKNAVHATSMKENPEITLSSFSGDGEIFIKVRDNGCGIPPEHIDAIFEPAVTFKGSNDRTQSYKEGIKGSGYGLANVKRFASKHKGRVSVVSVVGEGAAFTIAIPLIAETFQDGEEQNILPDRRATTSGKNALLVEDEPVYAEILKAALESSGHHVDVAIDGATALNRLGEKKYDAISLDYMLPDVTGIQIYNKIRETNREIPIVFVSGNFEYMQSMIDLKKSDDRVGHLSKPFEMTEYISTMNSWMSA